MKITQDEARSRFDLYDDDGSHVGEIEYRRSGTGEWYATHTEVFPPYEGRGLGTRLLDALSDHAREQEARIVPICPFVKQAFARFPEKYADVIHRPERR